MNKARRELLATAIATLEEVKSAIEQASEDEQEYVDNMPEGLQQGSKGEAANDAIEALEQALEHLDEAITFIGEAKGS